MPTTRGFTARPTVDKIAASIRRWEWTMPVLVDENGVLIAGHARLGAAAKLKLTLLPVL
jgi:ParB-like chromosome segregation protein Spo0J